MVSHFAWADVLATGKIMVDLAQVDEWSSSSTLLNAVSMFDFLRDIKIKDGARFLHSTRSARCSTDQVRARVDVGPTLLAWNSQAWRPRNLVVG